jgi:hypothetical protein
VAVDKRLHVAVARGHETPERHRIEVARRKASDRYGCHAAAFVDHLTAHVGALPALCQLTLCAFFATGLGDLGAHSTDAGRKPRISTEEGSRRPADVRAIPRQTEAVGQLSRVFHTSIHNMLARTGAPKARLNTRLNRLVGHETPPELK